MFTDEQPSPGGGYPILKGKKLKEKRKQVIKREIDYYDKLMAYKTLPEEDMEYYKLIANIPLPTSEQITNFIENISGPHSWYKTERLNRFGNLAISYINRPCESEKKLCVFLDNIRYFNVDENMILINQDLRKTIKNLNRKDVEFSFAFIDVDLYIIKNHILKFLSRKMVRGGTILVHDC